MLWARPAPPAPPAPSPEPGQEHTVPRRLQQLYWLPDNLEEKQTGLSGVAAGRGAGISGAPAPSAARPHPGRPAPGMSSEGLVRRSKVE